LMHYRLFITYESSVTMVGLVPTWFVLLNNSVGE
jgi:hypothetical protein